MNRLIHIMQNYLVIGFPFVIISIIWDSVFAINYRLSNANQLTKITWEVLSWNLMFWFIVLIIFLISLVTMRSIREKTLRRLANLKENDEREEYITGKAAKVTYLASMSLMILLFFFSIFSFSVVRVSPEQAINGKRLTANISLSFKLFNEQTPDRKVNQEIIFDSRNYSLSAESIILILLTWQVLIFNLAARKEYI